MILVEVVALVLGAAGQGRGQAGTTALCHASLH